MYHHTNSARGRRASSRGRGPYLLGDGNLGGAASIFGSVIGGATGVPGGSVAGGVVGNVLTHWFGGAATDATRQQRVNWMLQAAQQGSLIAARIILVAPANVSHNEAGMWQTAASQLPDSISSQAYATASPSDWPVGADFGMTAKRAAIQQELAQLGQRTPTSFTTSFGAPTPSTPGVVPTGYPGQPITGMRTTAPFNYTPFLIGAGALVFALSGGGRGRKRSRR